MAFGAGNGGDPVGRGRREVGRRGNLGKEKGNEEIGWEKKNGELNAKRRERQIVEEKGVRVEAESYRIVSYRIISYRIRHKKCD